MKARFTSTFAKTNPKPGLVAATLIVMVSLLLSACNFSIQQPTVDLNQVSTLVYQTAQARLTQDAFQTVVAQLTQVSQGTATQAIPSSPSATAISPTATTIPPTATTIPPTATMTRTPTKMPTATTIPPAATNTPKPNPVDWIQFVADVTIPDGTQFTPGTSFTKTWRLKNIGSSTWTTNYALVYASGESMGAQKVTNLTANVAPGVTVDLSLAMVAPANTGIYQGFWMLRNASGQLFGFGPDATKAFWVKIQVVKTENIVYNFVTNYCASGVTWFNGTGSDLLTCPGTPGNSNGSVIKIDKPTLENDTVSNDPGLRVEPQRVANGFIAGSYPAYTVQNGDHFKTVIGCWNGAAACDLIFALHIKIGSGPEQSLGSWEEKYDHLVRSIDINLSSLAGQNVVFILRLTGKGAPNAQNIGLWLLPRIVH